MLCVCESVNVNVSVSVSVCVPQTAGPWVCVWGWCWTPRGTCCSPHSYSWRPPCEICFPPTSATRCPVERREQRHTSGVCPQTSWHNLWRTEFTKYLVAGHGQAGQAVDVRTQDFVLSHSQRLPVSTEKRRLLMLWMLHLWSCPPSSILKHEINSRVPLFPNKQMQFSPNKNYISFTRFTSSCDVQSGTNK